MSVRLIIYLFAGIAAAFARPLDAQQSDSNRRTVPASQVDTRSRQAGANGLRQAVQPAPSVAVWDDAVVEGSPDWEPDHAYGPYGYGCCPSNCCSSPLSVRAELLLWSVSDSNLPPLITTSPAGTAANVAGILGQPGTQILFDGGASGDSFHPGLRVTAGLQFDPMDWSGLQANFFTLGRTRSDFFANNTNFPILARPVFDTQTNTETAMLVAHPNFLTGSINASTSLDFLGAEGLYRNLLYSAYCSRVEFLAGYRFLQLDEDLRISQTSVWTAAQGNIVTGTSKNLFDAFASKNEFHGGLIGLAYRERVCAWSLDMQMKLGLGNTHSRVAIDGQTNTTVPNAGGATFVGGLLAQQTNIGFYERDRFTCIPELTVTLSRDLTDRLKASVGGNLIYWPTTARLGDQVDRQVSQLPPELPTGTLQPAFNFETRGFWAGGLQLGLEYRF